MSMFTAIGGLDSAAIGTGTNAQGEEILIYDLKEVINIFKSKGNSSEEAIEWIDYALEQIEPEKKPIFITIDRNLPKFLSDAKGKLN